MSPTVWHDLFRPDPETWLLTDGTVIREPELQQTSTGLKVRLKDRPTVSAYTRDFSAFLHRALKAAAVERGCELWLPLGGYQPSPPMPGVRNHISDDQPLLTDSGGTLALVLAWRFRHGSLPLLATVQAKVEQTSGGRGVVTLWVEHTATHTVSDHASRYPWVKAEVGSCFAHLQYAEVDRLAEVAIRTTHEDVVNLFQDPTGLGTGPADYLGRRDVGSMRNAFTALARIISVMDDLASWPLPDQRVPDRPEILPLALDWTNCTDAVTARVRESADSTGIPEVIAAWEGFRAAMARVGFVPAPLREDELAMMLNNPGQARVNLAGLGKHKLLVDLANGQLGVGCALEANFEMSAAWQETVLMAEISGQRENLASFADAYLERIAARAALEKRD